MFNKNTSLVNKRKKSIIHGFVYLILTGSAITVLLYSVMLISNSDNRPTEQGIKLTDQVIQYKPSVMKNLEAHGKKEYTAIVLALMMQESGGRGDDPMQASESYCGEVGCIKDSETSIEQGVSYFSKVLDKSNGDVKVALQSYNFGAGFINYVLNNGGNYSEKLAIQFSKQKYEELKHTGIYKCIREEAEQYDACYGDYKYVEAVLNYYPAAIELVDDEVQVALVKQNN
ncbi:lysozyme family protein [Aquibacillus kalidii]|uniref:lysozyme family protein n=1 Tax=Aquibacillus kalidii TaxID=2762597 RepID=UPI002E28FD92|nr:lysozyme family protein [Aquibacillus kalidii]